MIFYSCIFFRLDYISFCLFSYVHFAHWKILIWINLYFYMKDMRSLLHIFLKMNNIRNTSWCSMFFYNYILSSFSLMSSWQVGLWMINLQRIRNYLEKARGINPSRYFQLNWQEKHWQYLSFWGFSRSKGYSKQVERNQIFIWIFTTLKCWDHDYNKINKLNSEFML